jgi:hypothetical protein
MTNSMEMFASLANSSKPPRRYRIVAGIDHNRRFSKINRTDTGHGIGNRSRIGNCLWLQAAKENKLSEEL